MAEKRLLLRALTPDRPLLEQEVDMVTFRTVEGDMGILPGHESCAVMLAPGLLRARRGDEVETFMVMGGFATVEQDKVVVMSQLAGRPEGMDALVADLERQREKRRREEEKWEHEIARAEMAIRRTLMEQDISVYSVLKGKGEEGQSPEGLDQDDE